jgi:hypothetical protein
MDGLTRDAPVIKSNEVTCFRDATSRPRAEDVNGQR